MDVEADPPQPQPVTDAIRAALSEPTAAPDPWWKAGIDDALEPVGE